VHRARGLSTRCSRNDGLIYLLIALSLTSLPASALSLTVTSLACARRVQGLNVEAADAAASAALVCGAHVVVRFPGGALYTGKVLQVRPNPALCVVPAVDGVGDIAVDIAATSSDAATTAPASAALRGAPAAVAPRRQWSCAFPRKLQCFDALLRYDGWGAAADEWRSFADIVTVHRTASQARPKRSKAPQPVPSSPAVALSGAGDTDAAADAAPADDARRGRDIAIETETSTAAVGAATPLRHVGGAATSDTVQHAAKGVKRKRSAAPSRRRSLEPAVAVASACAADDHVDARVGERERVDGRVDGRDDGRDDTTVIRDAVTFTAASRIDDDGTMGQPVACTAAATAADGASTSTCCGADAAGVVASSAVVAVAGVDCAADTDSRASADAAVVYPSSSPVAAVPPASDTDTCGRGASSPDRSTVAVNVLCWTGDELTCELSAASTLGDVKRIVHSATGVPASDLHVKVNGTYVACGDDATAASGGVLASSATVVVGRTVRAPLTLQLLLWTGDCLRHVEWPTRPVASVRVAAADAAAVPYDRLRLRLWRRVRLALSAAIGSYPLCDGNTIKVACKDEPPVAVDGDADAAVTVASLLASLPPPPSPYTVVTVHVHSDGGGSSGDSRPGVATAPPLAVKLFPTDTPRWLLLHLRHLGVLGSGRHHVLCGGAVLSEHCSVVHAAVASAAVPVIPGAVGSAVGAGGGGCGAAVTVAPCRGCECCDPPSVPEGCDILWPHTQCRASDERVDAVSDDEETVVVCVSDDIVGSECDRRGDAMASPATRGEQCTIS
jgi:hypothetical protein